MNSLWNISLHWTHKAKIRKLYDEGFTNEELAIMYKMPWSEVKRITNAPRKKSHATQR